MTIATGEKFHQGIAPTPEEVKAIYECHTLAQILYGQFARSHPWALQTPYPNYVPPMAAPHATSWTPPWQDAPSPMGQTWSVPFG